jgi:hypothetical protein
MSEYRNTHDNDDSPRFEPWLGMVAGSVLPVGAAFYLPSAFSAPLMIASVLLFVGGLIMLRIQSVRRARKQNPTQPTARPTVQATEESLVHEPTERYGTKRSLAPTSQLQVEDR